MNLSGLATFSTREQVNAVHIAIKKIKTFLSSNYKQASTYHIKSLAIRIIIFFLNYVY